ncbi:MAG: gliding motility-associated-like protein [Saprospiraceae bacterium]|jgi:gliding motility-associated-like protein
MRLSKKLFFTFCCLLVIPISLFAQNISYINPTFFGICETGEFQIQVTNDTGAPLQNTEVLIGLPVGVEYDNGTACQSTNLNAPVFCLGTIQSGETQTITFQARALCDAISTIDQGQLFCNSIILTHDGGTTSINPDCYEIDKPLLVITNVSNSFLTGTKGQILQRTITILNTLGGSLTDLTFTDAYQEGIIVSTDVGTVISNTNNTLEILLDGADFSQIGDGDEFFEQTDGALIITEFIEITACGIGQPLNSISDISFTYGCFGATCQQEETVAYINFAPSTAAPNLRYEPIVDSPSCFCGNEAIQQTLKIVNEGDEEATNISIEIDDAGMYTESFAIELGGTTTPLSPSFGGPTQYIDCGLTLPLAGFAVINIPELPAGDSLFILWDAYFCSFNECQEPRNSWFYKVDYFKGCPPPENLFIEMDEPILASDTTSLVPTEVIAVEETPDNILMDGEGVTFNYTIDADQLNQTEGTFYLDIEIPCDFIVNDLQDFSACGQEPTLTTAPTDSTVVYQLIYDLPLECDFSILLDLQFSCSESCGENFCKDTLITSCPDILLCTIEIPPTASVNYIASFDTPACARECGIKICSQETVNKDCPPLSYCEQIIPGYVDFDYELYRLNSGQGDSNDDRLPDGEIDWDLANRYHAMTGDTLRSELRGRVRIDVPGSTFNYGRVDLNMGADGLFFMTNNGLFDKETGTVPLSATLRIFDQSTNTYYDCDEPTLLPAPFFGFGYDISVNDLLSNSCTIPLNFQYSQGDSIILFSEYKVEYNLLPQDTPLPPVVNLNFEPEVFLYNESDPDDDDLFTCGCTKYGVQLTGYNYRIQEGSFGLRPCEDTDYGGGYLFRFELGEPNFFPFEYRPLGELTEWSLQVPADISITESKITFLRYQDGTDIAVEEIVTPIFSNNTYSFSLQDYQMPTLDEGYIFLFQHRFGNDCDLSGNFPLLTTAEVNFAPNLPELESPVQVISQSAALRMQLPALVLDTLITCDISFDNKNRWTLNVSNESDLATQNISLNTWIRPISETGGLIDFEIISGVTGLPFPSINGIFQLGDIEPTQSLAIQIIANNQSCEIENVSLEYGWNCEEYNDPSEEVCFVETLLLKGVSPPGEIALDEDNPMQTLNLCDLSPFFEVEIFNADLGAICNPNLEIILPNGFTIEPGTTEISYPMGAAFMPVGDPDVSTTNLAEWQINDLIPSIADNCLPGVTATPENGFTLRFKARTDCDFPSGSRLRFFTIGEQNCSEESNTSSELSEKIFITGADAPYTTSFNSPTQNLTIGCEDTETILVSFNASAGTLPGDSIYIFLPTGLQYAAGSYQAVNNASTTEPEINSTSNGILLLSEIPEGENQIIFQFDVTGLSALTCEAKFINIQTLSHANALCLTNNESCTVPVVTGDLSVQLIFNRPIFELSNLQINTAADNVVTYNLQVDNSGADTGQPTSIDFYAGGNIVHTHSIMESIGSTNITGEFFLTTGLLCDLTVLIDPATNCACETDELTNATSIDFEMIFSDTICSGEILEIGIPGTTGSSYQWSTPTVFLDCPTCPITDFSFVNQNQNNAFLSFDLTENNGNGCVINYNDFDIMIPVQIGILSAETEICIGDCATIIATEAANYQWTCGSVENPTAQVQTVCPTTTTTYCVAITDEFGCLGEEEVTVEVQDLPIANAGGDISFCPEDLAQLQAGTGEDYVYLWEPVTAVEDAAVANPVLTTTEDIILTLTVFANGCQSSDEINVTFGEVPNVEISTNVETICGNSFAQLTATGAETYEWLSSPDLSCLDCPNPQATPDALTTFYVLGTNAAGCFAIDSVTIDVSPDQIVTTLEPEVICAGEEYEFFGEMLTATGEYCEEFTMPTGCDSLVCLNLTVLEEIITVIQDETLCEGGSVVFEGMLFEETTNFCITFQTLNGCDSTRCLNLTVSPELTLDITLDTTILVGESVQLNVTEGYDTYNWTPETGLSCTDCSNPIATPDTTTTYQVTVIDFNGCERSTEMTVTITTDCDLEAIEAPNVFTPNSDGTNDVFRLAPNSKLLEVIQFEIYNRWGQLLYSNTGFDVSWDGEFKGVPAPADVYVYIIKAKCEGDEKVKEFLGDVTLVR